MKMEKLVLSDTKWGDPKSGGRCIKDYYREIKFSRELTPEELQEVCHDLHQSDDCPGWTGVRASKGDGGLYRFSTTMDSSD